MKVVHGFSAVFFGLAAGMAVLAVGVRTGVAPFGYLEFSSPGPVEWSVLAGVVGLSILSSLLWNGLQFQKLNREAREIYTLVEGARQCGICYYGLNEKVRGFGVSRSRFGIRGWAFGRGARRPEVYLQIGSRRIDPEWEDRVDVAEAFSDRFEVPRRCGFSFRFETGFGLKRIELRVADQNGVRIAERLWRVSLRRSRRGSGEFSGWFERHGGCRDDDLEEMRKCIQNLDTKPVISILLPVFNSPPVLLETAVRSVIAQVYPNWELCMVDDASSEESTREAVRMLSGLDERIRVRFRSYNGHISESTNTAFSFASGDYVGLLDHDDELTPNALAEVAVALAEHPGAKWVYSDEDKIDPKGNLSSPYFKPDYDPELLIRQNYICHFTVIEKRLFDRIGGMRIGLEGSQDWDCFLRLSREVCPEEVIHIPKILYHWRMAPGSSANTVGEKGYSVRAAERAIKDHLEALGMAATPRQVGGMYWSMVPDGERDTGGWNWVDLESRGAGVAWGALDGGLCLIGISETVLESVGAEALEVFKWMLDADGIGAVGPMVTDLDGRLLHAGTYLDPRGGVFQPFRGELPDVTGMGWRARLTQTQSGLHVPILAVRAEALRGLEVESLLDGVPVVWQPLVLSLALGESGWRSLYVPEVRVGIENGWGAEGESFPEVVRTRYGRWFDRDPCFNPNLSLEAKDLRPTSAPRSTVAAAGREYRR